MALEITVTSYAWKDQRGRGGSSALPPPQPPSKNVDESNPHGKVPQEK